MKNSQLIGIITALLTVYICFLPWSIVEERHIIIKGMDTTGTDFGRPGLLNIILCMLMVVFFSINKIWAKRTNLFFAAINFAWGIRNYILTTTCSFGECPTKKPALFILVFLCFITMLMSFFPKLDVEND